MEASGGIRSSADQVVTYDPNLDKIWDPNTLTKENSGSSHQVSGSNIYEGGLQSINVDVPANEVDRDITELSTAMAALVEMCNDLRAFGNYTYSLGSFKFFFPLDAVDYHEVVPLCDLVLDRLIRFLQSHSA